MTDSAITPHLDGPPPFTDDELAAVLEPLPLAHLAPDEEQQRAEAVRAWRPTDPDTAEWAMAKLADLEREALAVHTAHEEWAAKVERSRQDALRGLEHRISFFRDALRGYALAWHDEYPTERRTLHLPSGTVKTTTPQKPTVQLVPGQEQVVVGWLRGLDRNTVTMAKALKEPEPEPMISGVRKLVQVTGTADELRVVDPATGEVVPGLKAQPPGPTTAEPRPHLS